MRNAMTAAVALIISAGPYLALAAEDAALAPYRAKRMFYGCWTRTTPPKRPHAFTSHITRCFQQGRTIGGAYMASDGHGADFCERWRIERHRVTIWNRYGKAQRCLYQLSSDRRTLSLDDCPSAGAWRRDDRFGQNGWPCRGAAFDE